MMESEIFVFQFSCAEDKQKVVGGGAMEIFPQTISTMTMETKYGVGENNNGIHADVALPNLPFNL